MGAAGVGRMFRVHVMSFGRSARRWDIYVYAAGNVLQSSTGTTGQHPMLTWSALSGLASGVYDTDNPGKLSGAKSVEIS